MTLFQAAILGIVQGLTEFLPISSSGHLILFPDLLGWDIHSLTFDVAVHLATLGAIFVALWPRISAWWYEIKKGDKGAQRFLLKIILATIPAAVFGVLAGDWLEAQRTLSVVATMLIVWGMVLWIADYVAAHYPRSVMRDDKTSWPLAIGIGVAQAVALIPGVSRSGITMSVGLLAGLDRKTAATFSFLLAIPAIAGAGLLTAVDVAQTGLDVSVGALLVGCVTAFLSGVFAIRFLLSVIEKGGFRWFALYRIALGVFLLWVTIYG